MEDLIFKYPHTDLHSVNLDYILKIVRENAGLHLEISGNQLILKTADNTIISAVTIPYATEAGSANTASSAGYASTAGSASSAGYATTAGTAATATNATNAINAQNAAAADYATTAGSAASATTATNATNATNAQNAVNAQTAEYAETTGNVEHALNAFEAVAVQGNEMKFTKGDGSSVLFTPSFCSRADKDGLGNVIKATYISNVVDDNGTLKFQNAQGNTIVSLIPSVTQAQTDSYGNTIADYIKAIEVSGDSNYVTIDHGTGTSDTITIPYSEKAWKDTNGNVIKNTYIKRLEIVTDPNDGHKKLVAYNGDTPEAELFRIPVEAYYAQEAGEASHAAAADYATSAGTAQVALTTPNGDTIESYTKELDTNDSNYGDQYIVAKDGNGNVLSAINLFYKSRIVLGFKDIDTSNPKDPYTMNVGDSGSYIVENLADYGFSTIWDMLNPAVFTGYRNTSNVMIQWCPIYYSNGFYMISCFDYQGQAFKTFRITKGTADNEILLERFA